VKGILKKLGPNILLLGIVSFIADLSSDMLMPVLPAFLAQLTGGVATGTVVGLIGGLGDSVASLLKILSGYWSDKIGRRRPWIIGGYGLSAGAKLLFPAAWSWWHLLVLRPVERLGKGLRTAPRDAMISEFAPDGDRGLAYGFHRAMDSAGAVLGSLVALALVVGVGVKDPKVILLVAAIVAFAAIVPLIFVREPEGKGVETKTLVIEVRSLPRRMKLFLVAAALFHMGFFTYLIFIIDAMKRLAGFTGKGPADWFTEPRYMAAGIGLYALYNIVYTALSMPAGHVSDRMGRKPVLVMSYFAFALTNLAFIVGALGSYGLTVAALVAGFVIYGLTQAGYDAVERAFASDLARAGRAGTALGTYHALVAATALPSGLMAGALWTWRPVAAFVYGGALAALAAVLLAVLVPGRPGADETAEGYA
jgi:MFS family permease